MMVLLVIIRFFIIGVQNYSLFTQERLFIAEGQCVLLLTEVGLCLEFVQRDTITLLQQLIYLGYIEAIYKKQFAFPVLRTTFNCLILIEIFF